MPANKTHAQAWLPFAGMARSYKKASSTTVGAGHACEQNPSTGVATFRGHGPLLQAPPPAHP